MQVHNMCIDCNLIREVELIDRSRICVCDGGCDEMIQVNPNDEACEYFEDRWCDADRNC